MIRVFFFARLREQLNCEKTLVEPSESLTVSGLQKHLIEIHPDWKIFLSNTQLLFSVNQILVKSSHAIIDGDEVAFFPPVTGG